MRVSVIIPNYNGEKFIEKCLLSLTKQTYADFEVILVDNGSTDRSVELAEDIYPDINIIKLHDNYGFSRAVNEGIQASQAKYVILLNNDTEADEGFVENMVKGIDKSPKIFSCAAKMVQFNNRELIDSAGDYYTIIGCTFTKGYNKKTQYFNKDGIIFSSCAGAAIYRRKVFGKIGYFDEMHFAYLEDVDIGYRAKIHGYVNTYVPEAVVYHVGSGSSGSRHNEFKVRLAARNNVYLNYKNMPLVQLIINYPFILAGKLMKLVFMARKGLGKVYLDGVMEGYSTLSKCNKVKFRKENIPNYLRIEFELLANLFVKIGDFIDKG